MNIKTIKIFLHDFEHLEKIKKYFLKNYDMVITSSQAISFAMSSIKFVSGVKILYTRLYNITQMPTKNICITLRTYKKIMNYFNQHPLEFGNDYTILISSILHERADTLEI